MSAIPNSLSKTCMIHLKDLGGTDWTDIIIQLSCPNLNHPEPQKRHFQYLGISSPGLPCSFFPWKARNPRHLSFQVLKKRATTELLRPKTSPATVEFAFGSQVRVSQGLPGCTKLRGKMAVTRCWANRVFYGFLILSADERTAEPAITSYLFWSWQNAPKSCLGGSSHCIPAAAETS